MTRDALSLSAKSAVALAAVILMGSPAFAQTCPLPKPMSFRVESQFRRDVLGFTQGLEVHDGKLFESTGAIAGNTRLNTIDFKGHVTTLADLNHTFFGEGLTILRDQIYQLSWQQNLVFVYDLKGKQLRQMRNPRDGWGLTNDGVHLISTDGGDRLYFTNPANFQTIRSVQVRSGDSAVPALNELEYVDGKIYANIFTTWTVVRVEPRTGCIEAIADLNGLWDRMSAEEHAHIDSDSNFVLNGIAYDAANKMFYVTGKDWMTIFTGRFVPGN